MTTHISATSSHVTYPHSHVAIWYSNSFFECGARIAISAFSMTGLFRCIKQRRKASGEVQVCELMEKFDAWTDQRGSRDLQYLLRRLVQETTWKTAPSASVLDHYHDFYASMVEVVPNCMLPIKKFETVPITHDNNIMVNIHLMPSSFHCFIM